MTHHNVDLPTKVLIGHSDPKGANHAEAFKTYAKHAFGFGLFRLEAMLSSVTVIYINLYTLFKVVGSVRFCE